MSLVIMAASSSLINIEKLDGDTNYHQWKFDVADVLRLQGLWGIVIGRESRPEDNDEKITEWDRLDDKALSSIRLTMRKTQRAKFANVGTSMVLWGALQQRFQKQTIQSRIFLRQ